jgi:hypothetical protein
MKTNESDASYIMVSLTRRQEGSVIIRVPAGKFITEAHIDEAIAKTMAPDEWDTVGKIERGKRYEMEKEEAEEYHYLDPFARPTFAVRAAEIGVTTVTLRKWRDAGIDIFSDEAVKAHISKSRNHSFRINPAFKARLND